MGCLKVILAPVLLPCPMSNLKQLLMEAAFLSIQLFFNDFQISFHGVFLLGYFSPHFFRLLISVPLALVNDLNLE